MKLALAALLLAGCSFPDVTFGGGPASGGNGGSGGDGAAAPTGGSGNGGSDGGTGPIGGAPACDGDGDGVMKEAAGCCEADCDCDDTNPDVYPGQTMFFKTIRTGFDNPTLPAAFDYDCSGMSEKELPQGNCGNLDQCAAATTDEVFTADPKVGYVCGSDGTRRYCAGGCQQDPETLGCR